MVVAVIGATLSAVLALATSTDHSMETRYRCPREPGGIALILSAAFTLGKFNIKSPFSIGVMLVAFVLVLFFNVNILLVIVGAGLLGYLWHRFVVKPGGKTEK